MKNVSKSRTKKATSQPMQYGLYFTRAHYALSKQILPLAILLVVLFLLMSVVLVRLILWAVPAYTETGSLENNGFTLKTFVKNISCMDYEIHGEFDRYGLKFYEVTQHDTAHVRFPDVLALETCLGFGGEITFVHNHPNGSTFSVGDLLCSSKSHAQKKNVREIVISKQFAYCLEAPNGWPTYEAAENFLSDKTTNYLKSSEDATFSSVTPKDETTLSAPRSMLILRVSKDGTLEYVSQQTDDALLQAYADEFNLVYTKTPLEEWLMM